jgi:hypothetical protein
MILMKIKNKANSILNNYLLRSNIKFIDHFIIYEFSIVKIRFYDNLGRVNEKTQFIL